MGIWFCQMSKKKSVTGSLRTKPQRKMADHGPSISLIDQGREIMLAHDPVNESHIGSFEIPGHIHSKALVPIGSLRLMSEQTILSYRINQPARQARSNFQKDATWI
jgi:hypothetical protein